MCCSRSRDACTHRSIDILFRESCNNHRRATRDCSTDYSAEALENRSLIAGLQTVLAIRTDEVGFLKARSSRARKRRASMHMHACIYALMHCKHTNPWKPQLEGLLIRASGRTGTENRERRNTIVAQAFRFLREPRTRQLVLLLLSQHWSPGEASSLRREVSALSSIVSRLHERPSKRASLLKSESPNPMARTAGAHRQTEKGRSL